MSELQTTDWRALLVKYMKHVWDEEGSVFVPEPEWKGDFTDDELAQLKSIECEASKS